MLATSVVGKNDTCYVFDGKVPADKVVTSLRSNGLVVIDGLSIDGPLVLHDTVGGKLHFEDCSFEQVDLSRSVFCDTVEFVKCEFNGDTSFDSTKFGQIFVLEACNFMKPSRFSNSDFYGRVNIEGTAFHETTDWQWSRFKENCYFGSARFLDGVNFWSTRFADFVDFSLVRFEGVEPLVTRRRPQRRSLVVAVGASAAFTDTKFDSVRFDGTSLLGVVFEPSEFTTNTLEGMVLAEDHDGLQYMTRRGPLAQLRRFVKENGYRQQEREVTCALERHDQEWWAYLIFDLPFEYGANIARPLATVACLMLVCTVLYWLVFWWDGPTGLLVKEYIIDDHRFEMSTKSFTVSSLAIRTSETATVCDVVKRHTRLVSYAFFFSLLSCFNIGFRDISVGRWLMLILPRRTEYEAYGWVRVVSGAQSIVSVLLLAFGLLFYYGRVFD